MIFLTNESLFRRPGGSPGPLERAVEAAYMAGLHAGLAWGALGASLLILALVIVFGRRGDS